MSRARDAVRAGAPDPDDAARRLERILLDGDLSDDALAILVRVCQRAPYLAGLLAADPARLGRIAQDPYLRREKPAARFRDELTRWLVGCADDDGGELDARLRSFRGDEMVRLGARELGLGQPDEVGRELAHLADACFDAAIEFHRGALDQRFGRPRWVDEQDAEHDAELAVIGMGKHGGLELNFSSDVDVIYVYTSDVTAPGAAISLHEYFSKLCERVTASIGRVTDAGVVFRVDLRLRPEGSRGTIANSLPSAERYYETWGRPWERQAWLKARAAAGSPGLGKLVLETLRPFVFPRTTSISVVEEVTELNRRIKAELDTTSVDSGYDVKNGAGGIREIEFFAQALQLIHAGHRPALRVRSTLRALDQLLFAGIIAEAEHRSLVDAYRFLRHVEHVLQLESGRQTQRLPATEPALELLARRLEYSDAAALRRELARHTNAVQALFSTLGDDSEAPPPEVFALLSGRLERSEEERALGALRFLDPATAADNLERARRNVDSPLGPAARGAEARVGPNLLAEIGSSPDPDRALAHVIDLVSRRGSGASVWRMMDENPYLLRLIVSLFGTSQYLSRQFIQHPEQIDALRTAGSGKPRADARALDAALGRRLESLGDDDEEAQWNALAEFKNTEILRIGLADVGGALSPTEVSEELSAIAEICLRRAYALVWRQVARRHGEPRDGKGGEVSMAVLALGKLGGQELGYASDLDLVFVYSDDGESDGARSLDNVSFMTRVAQRLMSGLHTMHEAGRLYEIDTRLRPSGNKGLLVSSLAGWHHYHAGEAMLWERQALIKLRPVAGDDALGRAVADDAERCVWGHAPGEAGRESRESIASEVTAMRDRIEHELARGRDVKAGRGGLIDIEFAAQYLQLAHGYRHPELRVRGTVEALERAAALGVADPRDCSVLTDAYSFMRRLEHRMRIVHDLSVHVLPESQLELDRLARRVGLADGRALSAIYQRWTVEVRKSYERVLELAG